MRASMSMAHVSAKMWHWRLSCQKISLLAALPKGTLVAVLQTSLAVLERDVYRFRNRFPDIVGLAVVLHFNHSSQSP